MSLGEFDLIARWFTRTPRRADLGVGDDCALFRPAAGMQLAVSTDMLVEGRHFLPTVSPCALGHKALAVNLSDLAACGARPLAFTLALALPRVDEAFLEGLSGGLLELADAHGIELIGGDTTAGPLNLCITVFGEVPTGSALLRSGARAGDDLWVSGELGGARLALEQSRGTWELDPAVLQGARQRLDRPQPRVALGQALRGVATSAIDLSDGLAGDLGHVLDRSGVGAWVDAAKLPLSPGVLSLPLPWQHRCGLAGGDDYELLFTAPPAAGDAVVQAGADTQTTVTRIGRIVAERGLTVIGFDGRPVPREALRAYDHFIE